MLAPCQSKFVRLSGVFQGRNTDHLQGSDTSYVSQLWHRRRSPKSVREVEMGQVHVLMHVNTDNTLLHSESMCAAACGYDGY